MGFQQTEKGWGTTSVVVHQKQTSVGNVIDAEFVDDNDNRTTTPPPPQQPPTQPQDSQEEEVSDWKTKVRAALWKGLPLAVAMMLILLYISENGEKGEDTIASTTTGTMVQVTIEPDKPFIIAVPPGYRFDSWGDVIAESTKRGLDKVVTLRTRGDESTEIQYRLYLCTAQMPCANTDTGVTSPATTPAPPQAPFQIVREERKVI